MNIPRQTSFKVLAAKRALPSFKKCFSAWMVLALLVSLGVARVQAQDDDYLAVYSIIDQADALNTSGKTSQAHSKYIEAKQALVTFQQNYPSWNSATVNFRLKYLNEKIVATAAAPVTAPAPKPPVIVAVSADAPVASAASDTGDSAGVEAPLTVKLLDAGSEPRTVLRLHPVAGDKQTLSLTTKMSVSMSMGTNSMPAMNIPTTTMTMDIAVQNVSADGEITYRMVFGEPTVTADATTMPGVAEAMKTAMSGMKGLTGTGKISSKGVGKELVMNAPGGTSPQLNQAIGQMKDVFSSSSIIFPDEAVGAGAKWEYSSKVKSQGLTIDQTVDYELVSVNGGVATLHGTIKQQAANQMIDNPAMPGAKVNLTKMDGLSMADTTFDLGHVMAQMTTIDGNTAMSMSMGQQGQMDMSMKLNVTIEGK